MDAKTKGIQGRNGDRRMKENAIKYFKAFRKIFCEDHLKFCPKDSIAYQATLKEKGFYDMAIKALEQMPSEDCVSKQALINAFPISDIYTLDDIIATIKFQPPVTPVQKWISVSERQPEENGNYLAFYRSSDGTADLEFMMVDHCNAGGGWLHEESGKKLYKKVIAWMPLPKAYKAEMEIEE